MNPLLELQKYGQSVWLDQMQRSLLTTGTLKKLIDNDGLRGLTSNPTIFEKAISGSKDYEPLLERMVSVGAGTEEIYQELVLADIGDAADVFRPVYERTGGADGFVSLEVSPLLADDTAGTIKEAKQLFARLGRPNVMIKVPATPAGLPAIEELIAAGLNINVTLIFSIEVYEQVAEAYIRGLERRVKAGEPATGIASVASFFVSRIDTMVDKQLEEKIKATSDPAQKARLEALPGKTAIANAKLAYQSFKHLFHGERFAALKEAGARVQRQLWASTSTKNPKYRDVMYAEELIGAETVDTLPPATVDAFRDHGRVGPRLEQGLEEARWVFAELEAVGIDLAAVTRQLTVDGVKLFSDSYKQLLAVIETRAKEAAGMASARPRQALGPAERNVQDALDRLAALNFGSRIWKKDAALWKNEAEHQKIINNALGWLDVAEMMHGRAAELESFAAEIRDAGFQHVVVLGMGGSSLCPEVFRRTLGPQPGWPVLHVLDSTVPAAVLALEKQLELARTLFIVASKSGTTTEPQVFYRYFFDRVKQIKGEKAGANFIAITDPATVLESEAERDGFRRVFLNPADIGGRYSALSYFGMAPLALMGGDVRTVLKRALSGVRSCGADVPLTANPGARLGAALGALALAGRDKLTLVTPPPVDSLSLWIEQLIAESTGKEGKGIIPIAGEPLGAPDAYGKDRVFVVISTEGGATGDAASKLAALERAGHPVLRRVLRDPLDLGAEFFIWELATAAAGALLGINPFDQPNVQESKDNTKRLLAEYKQRGALPEQELVAPGGGLKVFAASRAELGGASSADDAISAHLERIRAGDYVAITQYIEELPEYDALLLRLRVAIRERWRVATTTGYGPRFLHSTGQLHKGGPASGVFLQLTSADAVDVPIPGEPFTFGVLKQAQALGDFESLAARRRRAIRVDLGKDVRAGLELLLAAVEAAARPTATAAR